MSEQALTKIHLNVDQSSLSGSSCMLRWWNTIGVGYREPKLSRDITYGIAVHAFADGLYQTKGDLAFAVAAANKAFAIPSYEKPEKKHMSEPAHMIDTCLILQREFINKDKDFQLINIMKECPYCDNKSLVKEICTHCEGKGIRIGAATEVNFSLPYYEDDYISVSLTGTIDKIGKFKNGIFAIGDWKTTSARSDDEYNIKNYLSNYEISLQLKFYVYCMRLMGQREPNSILGQVANSTTDGKSIGAFIDAIFIRTKSMENKYIRGAVYRFTDEQMVEFKSLLDGKLKQLSHAVQNQQFTRDGLINNTCQQKFGKCVYWNACKQTNPELVDLIYKRDFIIRKYNPLAFNSV